MRVRLSLIGAAASLGLALCACSGPTPEPSPSHSAPSPSAVYSGTPEERLMAAVEAGDVGAVQTLTASGQTADFWQGDATPLARAIVSGNVEMVQALLDSGATVEGDEWSHSVVAAQYGDRAMVDLILNRGGTATGPAESPGWVLAVAAYAGNVEAIEALVAAGAEPDRLVTDPNGEFPVLVYAVNGGSLEAVRALAALGADPYRVGSNGETAIDVAQRTGRTAIHEYLLTVAPED